MVKKSKRGALQISFPWLFAIIAGVVILSLAIYAVTKIIDTGGQAQSIKAAAQLEVLFNPLETSFESASATSFSIPTKSRIYNSCSKRGTFGKQEFQISQETFGEWTPVDLTGFEKVSFENKYVFSEEIVEGKTFYLFSKQFEFPFKVADLIYMTDVGSNYCFVNSPEEIEDEISSMKNKVESLHTENCPDNSIKVCFTGVSGCEINVNVGSSVILN